MMIMMIMMMMTTMTMIIIIIIIKSSIGPSASDLRALFPHTANERAEQCNRHAVWGRDVKISDPGVLIKQNEVTEGGGQFLQASFPKGIKGIKGIKGPWHRNILLEV